MRAAGRAALLTCSWRLSVLLREDAVPYGSEIQLLPERLLATSHLLELSPLARRQVPVLRAATETFQGAAPLVGRLALFPRRVRLKEPLQIPVAAEGEPALQALSEKLLQGEGTLAGGVAAALQAFAPPLRSMALSALAFGDAELLVE